MSYPAASVGQPRGANIDQSPPRSSGQTLRFVFLDALRGLAALLVAAHHIARYGPLTEPAAELIPTPLQNLLENGRLGVQVFFVISGFVIAYSVRKALVTPEFLLNFAVRRSLRLEPPYWTVIGLVLLLNALSQPLAIAPPADDPTGLQVFAHVFYAQELLGFEHISVGFWTLCIEFQFYLLFIGLLALAQQLTSGPHGSGALSWPVSLSLTFLPLALLSLFGFSLQENNEAWISRYFCLFTIGALVCWTLHRQLPALVLMAYLAALVLRLAVEWNDGLAVALVTGLAIYLAGRAGELSRWLNWSWLQYLGRISYSLYLVHYPVSHMIVNLGYEVTGDSPLAAVAWMLVALAASVAAAHLLYKLVEGPSVNIARRLRSEPTSVLAASN